MKVLVVVPSYKPAFIYGGPIRSLATLYEALQQQGIEIRVLTTNANGKNNLTTVTNQSLQVDGVEVTYFRRWTKDHSNLSPTLLWKTWQLLKQYDVVHLHSWWNLVTMPALLLCRLKGIKPIVSPRGMLTAYTLHHHNRFVKQVIHALLGKSLLRQCFFHVTSFQEQAEAATMVSPLKIYNIPNLLSFPKTVERAASSSHLHLLYLGRIDPKKNIEFIIKVVSQIRDVPIILEIIGDGEETYINQLKHSTSNLSYIHWIGPLHGEEKWIKYATADLLLLPSYNENYGNVVLESLSQGTPVLISDQVGVKDYVMKNELGWVCELRESEWEQNIRNVWNDSQLRRKIRERAPILIRQDFSKQTLVQQYMAMYEDVFKSQLVNC